MMPSNKGRLGKKFAEKIDHERIIRERTGQDSVSDANMDGEIESETDNSAAKGYIVIGVTGGIGTGKSTVLSIMSEMFKNAFIIEADKLAKELMHSGTEVYDRIVGTFGREILGEDGEIDSRVFAGVVLNDKARLEQLNSIVHPAVKDYIKRDIEDKRDRYTCYIIEAALLIQDGYCSICDRMVTVAADEEVRVRRLIDGRGYKREKAYEFIVNQPPEEYYIKSSDFVIRNDGTVDSLRDEVRELYDKIYVKDNKDGGSKGMKVLVVNAGSTSLKYQLIDSESEAVLAKGLCERIGIEGGKVKYNSSKTGEKKEVSVDMPDHGVALKQVIDILLSPEDGAIESLSEIDAVGHRVVHGGEYFNSTVVVDDDVIEKINACSDLAPLHNPANLLGIKACAALMPEVPQCVTFDTAFHQTMPAVAYTYAIPYEYYEKYKIRRYGFHGTSHSFVSNRALEIMGLKDKPSKLIVCHMGGGASITAVKDGKSVDTSMGLTPLEGMVMGTRSGSLDPAIVQFIADKEKLSADEVLTILNKKSGLEGLSGRTSDIRDVDAGVAEGDARSILAYDVFCYSAVKIIGSYIAAMNGLDGLVFTAGIGENDATVRKTVCDSLGFMGVEIDDAVNDATHGVEAKISTEASKIPVYVIPTNEELAIAREAAAVLAK